MGGRRRVVSAIRGGLDTTTATGCSDLATAGARMQKGDGCRGGAASVLSHAYWNSVASEPAGGSDEFAMTWPLTAMVGVAMPEPPGWMGVFSVIAVT